MNWHILGYDPALWRTGESAVFSLSKDAHLHMDQLAEQLKEEIKQERHKTSPVLVSTEVTVLIVAGTKVFKTMTTNNDDTMLCHLLWNKLAND